MMVRRDRPEYAVLISLAICVYIFALLLEKLSDVIDFAEEVFALVPVDSGYFVIILKMIGITYVAEFASGVCADFGCSVIGKQIELFARISIIVISVPVLSMFIESIESFL
jgi:stage III sporulation protein AD